jgi:hypothetical protein
MQASSGTNPGGPSSDAARRGWSSGASLVRAYRGLLWLAWGFLLVSLPFTTFPFVARTLGGGQASPLAGIPLLVLVVVWLAPNLLLGGRLPTLSRPLLLLGIIALATGAASLFLEIYPAFGQEVLDRVVRGLVTLAIGLCFYLVASKFARSERALRISLILLYVGAVVMLVWASIQAYLLIQGVAEVPDRLNRLHRLVSMRDMSPDRVVGFAFEPSWLADLLIVLYIPLWSASVIRGYTVLSLKASRWSAELLLLIWGLGIFFLTFSRIGYVALFAVGGALGLTATWRLAGRITGRVHRRPDAPRSTASRLRQWLLWAVMVILLLAMMTALLYAAGLVDKRIARLFTYDYARLFTGGEESIYSFANRLAYAERVVYWAVGFRAFALHPVLGVGLGDIGFFYRQSLPSFGYGLVEMIWILEGKLDIPNAKNVWVRLLGETGIAGFLAYSVWLGMIALAGRVLASDRRGLFSVLGLAGMMAVLAQVVEGFSLDSFALPQLWVITGLVTAAIIILEAERRTGTPPAVGSAGAGPRTNEG